MKYAPLILDLTIAKCVQCRSGACRDGRRESSPVAPLKSSKSAFHFADACTSASNSATPVSVTYTAVAMLKPRYFSTLCCLQHENPLVRLRLHDQIIYWLMLLPGTSALRRTSADAPDAARVAAKEKYQRRKESRCRIICKGWRWEEYSCRYALLRLKPWLASGR